MNKNHRKEPSPESQVPRKTLKDFLGFRPTALGPLSVFIGFLFLPSFVEKFFSGLVSGGMKLVARYL